MDIKNTLNRKHYIFKSLAVFALGVLMTTNAV